MNVSVDVKARFQAQVELDLSSKNAGLSTLDDKLRLGKGRLFHNLITSSDNLPGIIQKLNTDNNLTDVTYKTITTKGDFAEVTVQCNSLEAIQSFYNCFLRKNLKIILEKVLLTRALLREAKLDNVGIDVDIQSEHISRCEKKFQEAVVKARGSRYEK